MSTVEAYVPINGSAGNSAPVSLTGGKRKLKLVTKKQAKRLLKAMGKKMRGGETQPGSSDTSGAVVVNEEKSEMGGRRRRHTKKTHRRRGKSLFGLKY